MAVCTNCGTKLEAGAKFCPDCGTAAGTDKKSTKVSKPAQNQKVSSKDAEDNKFMAIVAYILFFIPLIAGTHKTSPFVKYHTNQGTVLFIVEVAVAIISIILRSIIRVPYRIYGINTGVYYTPAWVGLIIFLFWIPTLILFVLGIINVVKGECKPLPVIGKFTIIK